MGHIVLFMHSSLDGFASGPNGEMNWIYVDEEIFDFVGERVATTTAALYGRKTFEMMESYWPTAGDEPDAGKHDKEHSAWYNKAHKVVLSTTLKEYDFTNTTVIGDNVADALTKLKSASASDILLFGSPTATHSLLAQNLIDECWIFVNPVLLGKGVPVFKDVQEKQSLQLAKAHIFSSGVVCLQHVIKR